jgi:hypothetical protein
MDNFDYKTLLIHILITQIRLLRKQARYIKTLVNVYFQNLDGFFESLMSNLKDCSQNNYCSQRDPLEYGKELDEEKDEAYYEEIELLDEEIDDLVDFDLRGADLDYLFKHYSTELHSIRFNGKTINGVARNKKSKPRKLQNILQETYHITKQFEFFFQSLGCFFENLLSNLDDCRNFCDRKSPLEDFFEYFSFGQELDEREDDLYDSDGSS